MNGQTSIIGMFGEGADAVTNDMDRIVGKSDTIGNLKTCAAGCWITHPFNKEKRNACLAACAVKFNVPSPVPPSDLPGRGPVSESGLIFQIPDWAKPQPQPQSQPQPQPVSGSILDFSSPLNTIIKSFFLLSLSPMFAGSINFYIISVGCSGAIIYSLFKLFNR